MSALPHPGDVAARPIDTGTRPITLPRSIRLDGLARAGRIAALCCLVLLVPGEADRFASGDFSRPG